MDDGKQLKKMLGTAPVRMETRAQQQFNAAEEGHIHGDLIFLIDQLDL